MNLLERMRAHDYVKVKDLGDGLYACNFTRKAFYKGVWDEVTCKARGLILDEEGNVRARGFEKFFGIDEPNGPTFDEYIENAAYPIHVAEKANGYLAIVANIEGRLMAFSKSGYTDYSLHAMKLMDEAWTPIQKAELLSYLRNHNLSLLIEVIDPEMDPHIVAYDRPELVLLGFVHNQEEFEMAEVSYYMLSGLCWSPMVRKAKSPAWLMGPVTAAAAVSRYMHTETVNWEGVVLTDANGRMVKVKNDTYKLVKSYRTSLNRALKGEVDERAGAVMDCIGAAEGLVLEDFVVDGLSGPTLDLPALRPYILEMQG